MPCYGESPCEVACILFVTAVYAGQREKLWRKFFSDPSQWWDNRPEKVNNFCPNFLMEDVNMVSSVITAWSA
jgi:hypothetical protein